MPGALRIAPCACLLSALAFSHKALAHNNKTALGKVAIRAIVRYLMGDDQELGGRLQSITRRE